MRNISSNNFIICLGDDVRYRFAQELMPEGHLIDTNSLKISKSYVFIYSKEENVITDEKRILLYTSKIHEGRILEFPLSGIDLKSSFEEHEKIRKYIIDELVRGCSLYTVRGGYSDNEEVEIQALLTTSEFSSLMEFIRKNEFPAFITAGNCSEVYGLWLPHKQQKKIKEKLKRYDQ